MKLRQENEERNEQFEVLPYLTESQLLSRGLLTKIHQRIFLAIPTTSVLAFFPAILTSRSLQAKFVSVLAITSLLSTAYILVFIPNRKAQDPDRKRPMRHLEPDPGLVHQYLGYLNAGLGLLLSIYAFGFRGKTGVHDGFWMLCFLPGRECSVVRSCSVKVC